MKVKDSDYGMLARTVRANNNRIVIYGAGMIGQIVVPYVINEYRLHDYVDFYVDMDARKIGTSVVIGNRAYEIRHPDSLREVGDNTVVLLTNSKFSGIIDFLNDIDSLKEADCYIIPIMQKMERHNTIPKTIHYCWFGGMEMPSFLQECMESWHRVCPDYKIVKWDESSFDVSKYTYTKQAYEKGRYGFVTDVARLDILYNHGGIYLDTDVKLIKPLDSMLTNKGFVGFERWGNINSGGGIGAVQYHPMIREMLDYRIRYPFVFDDGSLNIETNGMYETVPFIRRGLRIDNTLQIVNDMTVYPAEFFHPYDYMSCEEQIRDCTVSVHYFYGGWMEDDDKKNREKTQNEYLELINGMEGG